MDYMLALCVKMPGVYEHHSSKGILFKNDKHEWNIFRIYKQEKRRRMVYDTIFKKAIRRHPLRTTRSFVKKQ
jgi:hypothetical protein